MLLFCPPRADEGALEANHYGELGALEAAWGGRPVSTP